MSIYEDITNKIVAEVESGVIPWLKPWKNNGKADGILPFNASTGRPYNGINIMLLWMVGTQYTSNGWVTYKQAEKMGGNVKKGEKSTQVIFWKFSKILDEDGNEKTIPFARGYNVFNLDQCEGIEYDAPKNETKPCQALDLANNNDVNLSHGGDKACYIDSPIDMVKMPQQDQFKSLEDYNATLNHEIVHWSGNESRMNREFGRRFGDAAYAMEELVAEIGSAFLCAHQGIEAKLQHAEYVGSWLKKLKEDKRAIFTAASKAQQAVEFLMKAETIQTAD